MQLGPQILLAAGGQLLDPAVSLLPPPAAAPKRTKISAMVQVCAAGIAAQSALPGALQHAEEWRVGGCGRAQGQGLGRRHAGSPAALPTWPPMVAKCSGAMVLHLMAIRGAPSSPRAEI